MASIAVPTAGLALGAVVGAAGWFAGPGAALSILCCALFGMGAAWLVYGAAAGRLDVPGALRALRRRDLR